MGYTVQANNLRRYLNKYIFNYIITSLRFFFHLEDKEREELLPLKDIRDRCIHQLEQMRPDHMRRLNPTPYKV